ncbi:MAG: zinc ABC transporter substrate-binding protein [Sporolactobacillus sp.]
MKKHLFLAAVSAICFVLLTAALSGCGNAAGSANGKIVAIGAENEYADVISQIGGKYVDVTAIMSNPETDPHTYEASTTDASTVSKATLIVQNGLGYDDFMNKLEKGAPNSKRQVITVAKSLGYADDTKNPHLWYDPDTMTRVATLVEKELIKQRPAHKSYFQKQLQIFNQSLKSWYNEIDQLKQTYAKTGVAVTEPVSDYLLQAADLDIKTPWSFQAAVMNGTDPSPQDVKTQQTLFAEKKVKAFLYNRQAVDDATTALLKLAKAAHIPVVGVYETMPAHDHYQQWMEAETKAITKAFQTGASTESLND